MSLTMLDLNGEARPRGTWWGGPVAPVPRIWVGFLIAFGFLAGEFVEVAMGNESAVGPVTLVIAVVGWIYWLSCVHRFHKILGQIAPHVGEASTYPYSPGEAVGRHFLPFYNLYWTVKWPQEMAKFLNEDSPGRIISGAALGFLVLGSLVLRAVDGFLGFSLLFGVGAYMAAKLRQAVAEHERIRGAAGVFA